MNYHHGLFSLLAAVLLMLLWYKRDGKVAGLFGGLVLIISIVFAAAFGEQYASITDKPFWFFGLQDWLTTAGWAGIMLTAITLIALSATLRWFTSFGTYMRGAMQTRKLRKQQQTEEEGEQATVLTNKVPFPIKFRPLLVFVTMIMIIYGSVVSGSLLQDSRGKSPCRDITNSIASIIESGCGIGQDMAGQLKEETK